MKRIYFLPCISILCWSTVAVITKLLLSKYNNIQVLCASSFFAAGGLLVVNIVSGNIKVLKTYKIKDFITTILIGFPGTFLYYMFYYLGADLLPASQAFIINYTWPIMSVLFACIILKEKMTTRKGTAIIVSFLGVAIVICGEFSTLNYTALVGSVMCILGAISYGVFTALTKKSHYDKRISMMLNYFVTFLLTSIINLINGGLFCPDVKQIMGFAWNGIFTMALANTIWILALAKGNTAKISNLAYITPFLSMIWSSSILKDRISLNSIVGLIVIVLGILIQLKDKSQNTTLPTTK